MADRLALARRMYDAYTNKDRASIEGVLAPEFHFTSPLDNRLDRATYFERCWPNSEKAGRFTYIDMVEHGDRVHVTYEAEGKGGRFRNTEVITFRGDQAVEVEVYFGWNIPHKAPPGGFVHGD